MLKANSINSIINTQGAILRSQKGYQRFILEHLRRHSIQSISCVCTHCCILCVVKKPYMQYIYSIVFNRSRPRKNGCHCADDVFNCIFLNENVRISLRISLEFVSKISALVPIMAWRRSGDKPLSEPMMVSLPTCMRHSASMS